VLDLAETKRPRRETAAAFLVMAFVSFAAVDFLDFERRVAELAYEPNGAKLYR